MRLIAEIKADIAAKVEALRAWHADQKKAGAVESSETEFQNRKTEIEALKAELTKAEAVETQAADRDSFLASIESELRQPGQRRTAEEGVEEFDAENPYTEERTSLNRRKRRWGRARMSSADAAVSRYILAGGDLTRLSQQDRQLLATGQAASPGSTGGILLPSALSARFVEDLADFTFMVSLCAYEQVDSAGSLGYMGLDDDTLDPDWTPELKAVTAGETNFKARVMEPHLNTKETVLSKLFLKAVPNAAQYVLRRLARKEAVSVEKAGLVGSGNGQPLGVFTASPQGVGTARDSQVGSGTDVTYERTIRFRQHLKQQYRTGSIIVGSGEYVTRSLLLVDDSNRPLWVPSLSSDVPDRLIGHAVYESDYAPSSFVSGAYVAAIFKPEYFQFVDFFGGREIEKHPLFVRANKDAWISRSYVDGMPLLADAFSRMQLP